MQRRRSDLRAIDCANWPGVDVNALDEATRVIYAQRQRAIERYLAGDTVRKITQQTQLANRNIYRLLARCLAMHPDGRVYCIAPASASTSTALAELPADRAQVIGALNLPVADHRVVR